MRLVSLDVFRGFTIAGRILVNLVNDPTHLPLLTHSAWHGCTFADLIFPWFILILGISLTFTLSEQRKQNVTLSALHGKIFKRTLMLLTLGLLLNAFPNHFALGSLRFYGVLQRIAICYYVGSLLFLTTSFRSQVLLFLGILMGYWFILTKMGSYDLTPTHNLAAYVDRWIFSRSHLYGKVYDPEGLISTLPVIASVLAGMLTGAWLISSVQPNKKWLVMLSTGVLCAASGFSWSIWFPLNKALWTSSYVLWTTGLGLIVFAFFYKIIEIRRWSLPFALLGINALFVYIAHLVFFKIQVILPAPHKAGPMNLHHYIIQSLHRLPLINEQLMYAMLSILFWFLWVSLMYVIGLNTNLYHNRLGVSVCEEGVNDLKRSEKLSHFIRSK